MDDDYDKTVVRIWFIVALAVVLVFSGLWLCIADWNHTTRDRAIACSQAGGSFNSDNECEVDK